MSTASRGYGYAHQRLREKWRPRVERGEVYCCLPGCGLLIFPGEAWDLAHDPMDKRRWLGPSHARCNRNTTLEKRLRGLGRRGFHWRSDSW